MVKVALTEEARKGVIYLFLIAVALFWFLSDSYQAVRAETGNIIVNLSMQNSVRAENFFRQAEVRVSKEIKGQFSQNPDLSEIEVVVVGDRHGEIVPILTTTVSRVQWQHNPRVSVWTQYYNASYALLHRHQGQRTETVASNPIRATINAQSPLSAIHQAFDEGRLSGTEAQKYLNELD